MTHPTVERKYALTKIEAGDYLLLGNDGKTLWRVVKSEDGPSHGLDPKVFPKDFVEWQAWKWTGREHPETVDDLVLGDDRWDYWERGDSREEAIQAALRSELPKPKPAPRKDSRPLGQILYEASVKNP